jgi:hypothetical protein
MIRIRAKISRIRNTGKTFKKCWLKLILYVLNSKNLHNETISRNNLYEISRNVLVFEKFTYRNNFKIIYTKFCKISRNFAKESTTKFRGILRNFAKLKSLSSLFRISRNKKNTISRPPYGYCSDSYGRLWLLRHGYGSTGCGSHCYGSDVTDLMVTALMATAPMIRLWWLRLITW